jgi:hypothetical protein
VIYLRKRVSCRRRRPWHVQTRGYCYDGRMIPSDNLSFTRIGRMIPSDNLSFTRITLVGWMNGGSTQVGWDRFGCRPLRLRSGTILAGGHHDWGRRSSCTWYLSIQSVSRRKHKAKIAKISWLTLLKEIILIYSENHIEPINTKRRINYCYSRWYHSALKS